MFFSIASNYFFPRFSMVFNCFSFLSSIAFSSSSFLSTIFLTLFKSPSFLFSFLPLSLSSSCWSLHLCSFLFRISYDLTNPTEHVAGFLMVARAPRMSLMQGTSPNWRSNGPVTDCRPSSTSTGRIDQPIGATTGAFMASLIVFKATTPECSDPPLGWYFWKLKQWEGTQTHTHNLASYEFLCGCHGSSLDHFQKPIASATWLSCDS